MNSSSTAAQRNILTVTQLNRATSQLLGEHFLSVLVEGEISNFAQPSSGHLYFSL
jgi:exodeoxyribonuclease VII large subunit